ncbi:prepilin-type N-terminal cleavage/methylation domain-containing protein [Nesterenkonia populi]|uniref:prepilin-type N-terminal cleavage/methylation domain-containing protein n=1 Tax=Nesterenkonia populi TaxID=1591087 RepID=UPI0011BE4B82|nr:prepilin-type N-terminal cleavage/methylation domain-containing protein [Nesterenkonia populi]
MSTLDRVLNALNKKRAELKESEAGFSLVELLVVVLIIAVLAAIAVPLYLSSVDSAEEAAAEATCSNALSMYTAEVFENGGHEGASADAVAEAIQAQSDFDDDWEVRATGSDDSTGFDVLDGDETLATCSGVTTGGSSSEN